MFNENVRKQLGLRIRDRIPVTLADGTKREVDYAGPVKVIFRKRFCITDAFVVVEDEEVLLGAVPMELMDLVSIPSINSLEYNPAHPGAPNLSMRKVA